MSGQDSEDEKTYLEGDAVFVYSRSHNLVYCAKFLEYGEQERKDKVKILDLRGNGTKRWIDAENVIDEVVDLKTLPNFPELRFAGLPACQWLEFIKSYENRNEMTIRYPQFAAPHNIVPLHQVVSKTLGETQLIRQPSRNDPTGKQPTGKEETSKETTVKDASATQPVVEIQRLTAQQTKTAMKTGTTGKSKGTSSTVIGHIPIPAPPTKPLGSSGLTKKLEASTLSGAGQASTSAGAKQVASSSARKPGATSSPLKQGRPGKPLKAAAKSPATPRVQEAAKSTFQRGRKSIISPPQVDSDTVSESDFPSEPEEDQQSTAQSYPSLVSKPRSAKRRKIDLVTNKSDKTKSRSDTATTCSHRQEALKQDAILEWRKLVSADNVKRGLQAYFYQLVEETVSELLTQRQNPLSIEDALRSCTAKLEEEQMDDLTLRMDIQRMSMYFASVDDFNEANLRLEKFFPPNGAGTPQSKWCAMHRQWFESFDLHIHENHLFHTVIYQCSECPPHMKGSRATNEVALIAHLKSKHKLKGQHRQTSRMGTTGTAVPVSVKINRKENYAELNDPDEVVQPVWVPFFEQRPKGSGN